jgi:hypothetical protein
VYLLPKGYGENWKDHAAPELLLYYNAMKKKVNRPQKLMKIRRKFRRSSRKYQKMDSILFNQIIIIITPLKYIMKSLKPESTEEL